LFASDFRTRAAWRTLANKKYYSYSTVAVGISSLFSVQYVLFSMRDQVIPLFLPPGKILVTKLIFLRLTHE